MIFASLSKAAKLLGFSAASPQAKAPGLAQQQISNATIRERHLPVLQEIRQGLEAQQRLPKKILSFGCSLGFECLDLASVFPEAKIFGCDIDLPSLDQAQRNVMDKATIFYSAEAELKKHGPFDLICIFNVLCRYPQSRGMDDISSLYPFSAFDAILTEIDSHVPVGGGLALYNAAYFFEDATIAAKYAAAPAKSAHNGWIERSDKSGARLFDSVYLWNDKWIGSDKYWKAAGRLFRSQSEEQRVEYAWHSRMKFEMRLRPGFHSDHSKSVVLWEKTRR